MDLNAPNAKRALKNRQDSVSQRAAKYLIGSTGNAKGATPDIIWNTLTMKVEAPSPLSAKQKIVAISTAKIVNAYYVNLTLFSIMELACWLTVWSIIPNNAKTAPKDGAETLQEVALFDNVKPLLMISNAKHALPRKEWFRDYAFRIIAYSGTTRQDTVGNATQIIISHMTTPNSVYLIFVINMTNKQGNVKNALKGLRLARKEYVCQQFASIL